MTKNKAHQCYVCGVRDHHVSLHKESRIYLCETCHSSAEWEYGYPLRDDPPKRCPHCGNRDLDTDRAGEDDIFDEELAVEFGFDPDVLINDYDAHLPFCYEYAFAVREECQSWFPYGPRYYWSNEDGNYTLPRPLTESQREEIGRVLAGQLELPGFES
jgi:DNA-directed RNA polymerase subunit RPC12/RpoP